MVWSWYIWTIPIASRRTFLFLSREKDIYHSNDRLATIVPIDNWDRSDRDEIQLTLLISHRKHLEEREDAAGHSSTLTSYSIECAWRIISELRTSDSTSWRHFFLGGFFQDFGFFVHDFRFFFFLRHFFSFFMGTGNSIEVGSGNGIFHPDPRKPYPPTILKKMDTIVHVRWWYDTYIYAVPDATSRHPTFEWSSRRLMCSIGTEAQKVGRFKDCIPQQYSAWGIAVIVTS